MIDLPNQAACSLSITDWTVLEWSCRVFVNRDDFIRIVIALLTACWSRLARRGRSAQSATRPGELFIKHQRMPGKKG
jgi:hypothetical protein